jgi:hypothetical protein
MKDGLLWIQSAADAAGPELADEAKIAEWIPQQVTASHTASAQSLKPELAER